MSPALRGQGAKWRPRLFSQKFRAAARTSRLLTCRPPSPSCCYELACVPSCVFEAAVWTESLSVPVRAGEEAAVAGCGVVAGGLSWSPSARAVASLCPVPWEPPPCAHRSSHSFASRWSHVMLLNAFYFVWKHFEK